MENLPTYWFIFIGNSLLLRHDGSKHSVPCCPKPPVELKEWTPLMELPPLEGIPCMACKIDVPPAADSELSALGLRESWGVLSADFYNMAGKAYELLYWDSSTKYCGVCGAPMKKNTPISKKCSHCGKECWPQVSPAIIVRICKGDDILLVHARNFRRSEMYGLVAGFVETGETLEECVVREVKEEVGIDIKNIQYFGSQPWPYPCGIMIGFTADYAGGELQIQQEELSHATWFNRKQLPPIPDKLSIARKLIDDYIFKSQSGI